MTLAIKQGMKLNSAVCMTQIMVLRSPGGDLAVLCGGAPMQVEDPQDKAVPDPEFSGGTLAGKRYVDAEETMEFLCTRGGEGSVCVNGELLDIKQAKKLPSSD